jgi:hypothetical protein
VALFDLCFTQEEGWGKSLDLAGVTSYDKASLVHDQLSPWSQRRCMELPDPLFANFVKVEGHIASKGGPAAVRKSSRQFKQQWLKSD